MGNNGSSGVNGRRRNSSRRSHPQSPPPMQAQPEITANRNFFAVATPYTNTPDYYHYPGSYPLPLPPPPSTPVPLPVADHHHTSAQSSRVNGRYVCRHTMQPPALHVEHQKAVIIRNDVNIKKETLRIEPDEVNPGKYLVAFTFDATMAGSITIVFFAKEGEDGCLTPMKESLLPQVSVQFQTGLSQKFRQPSGTGIDLSIFEEVELSKMGDMDVYPLAFKAEASSKYQNGNLDSRSKNVQITQAMFEMEKGEYQVRAVKQVLWINGMRYELQEIYGIGTSVEGDLDGNDPGKECVICLSETRDVAVLPCRHMCMCSGCAKVLRFQTNRCPICRQPVERLLEIKVSNVTNK